MRTIFKILSLFLVCTTYCNAINNSAYTTDTLKLRCKYHNPWAGTVVGVNRWDLQKCVEKSHLEDYIFEEKLIQEYVHKIEFDYITYRDGYKTFNYSIPYDTSLYEVELTQKEKEYIEAWRIHFEKRKKDSVYAQEYEEELIQGLENDKRLKKAHRGDYWNEFLALHKKYASPDWHHDIRTAINEYHEAFALPWEDSIYVWDMSKEKIIENIKIGLNEIESGRYEGSKSNLDHYFNLKKSDSYFKNSVLSTAWEKDLQFIQKTGEKNNAPIKLKGYKETGSVKSEKHKKKVIKELFSPHSCIALKNGPQAAQYGIYNIGFIGGLLPERENIEAHLEKLKEKLGEIIEPGMKMVQLEWEYKNYTYYTTAFVSQKTNCIVYDNVGSIATGEIIEGDITKELEDLGLPYRNTSEKREEGLQVVQPAPFGKSRVEKDLFGSIKYSCYVFSEAKFNEEGVLEEHETKHDSYAAPLFDCKAEIRKIESKERESNQCSFAWIMGYGTSPVKLIWGSNGRPTVSCADDCEQGEGKHKPAWW